MFYKDIDHFLSRGAEALQRGPVALIFAEDGVELDTTLRHHRHCGFRSVILFGAEELAPPRGPARQGPSCRP